MSRRQVREARRLCRGCLVARDCLAFALTVQDDWGVWGGFTSAERDRALDTAGDQLAEESTHLQRVAVAIALFDSGELSALVIRLENSE